MSARAPESPVDAAAPRDVTGWRAALGLALLVVCFAPGLLEHVGHATGAEPLMFADDARQHVFAFYPYTDPELFRGDYVAEHARALSPSAHRLLYRALAPMVDPFALSAVLPYLQLALLCTFAGVAAHRLGGWLAVWSALALLLSSGAFLNRMVGGVPRAWALPLVAAAAASLVHGRVGPLVGVTLFGAVLYPSAGLLGGAVLALLLFVVPARDRGVAAAWSLPRRVGVVVATAVAALILIAPAVSQIRSYGPRLGASDVARYPELGPGGRYAPNDRPPFRNVVIATFSAYGDAFIGGMPGWVPPLKAWIVGGERRRGTTVAMYVVCASFILLSLAGYVPLAQRSAAARRLLALPAAAMGGYVASVLMEPHLFLPQRFTAYGIPVFAVLAFPAGIATLAARVTSRRTWPWWPVTAVVVATLACLLLVGGRGGGHAGLTIRRDGADPVMEAIRSLPKDAVVAGWPSGAIDDVPLLARRRAFVTRETHQVFSRDFAEEMRRRVHALIDAYFAGSPEALLALRDEHGVTHLLVDLRHLSAKPPRYFAPFDDRIAQAHEAMGNTGSEVGRQLASAGMFRHGDKVILDLARVAAAGGPGSR